ncbi:MAG TPA: hypothetical protein VJU15_04570 [Gemmatimonadales bacterium]|nr:hypothetical protein [Gemmatimonadales bacterium]
MVDSPLVDIGGKAGDPAYDLPQVTGVIMLADGRLAVGVGGAYQVRFFAPDGTHLATLGRKGSGPGEFQALGAMWRFPGDSVMVTDFMLRRLTVVSDSGQLGRSFSLGGEAGFQMPQGGRFSFAMPGGILPDGRVLAVAQAFRVNDARPGAYRDSADYILYSNSGSAPDTLGRFPAIEMEQVTMTMGAQSFSAPTPVPLGKTTPTAIVGNDLMISMNDRWEIEQHRSDGTLKRLIRLNVAPKEIGADDISAHRNVMRQAIEDQPMLRGMPTQIKQQMFDRVEKASYPKTFPFIAAIDGSADGSTWVFEQARPGVEQRVYAVFDSSGAFLGRVTFPDRFEPRTIGVDKVAGVWKDADDVEHVRVYAIRKSSEQ